MTILAIDTATGPCSAAVWKDGKVAAYVENARPVMQSASLMPMVEEALVKSGVSYRDLSSVACTIGPGSFTGIRVGLAAARGIAFAAGIKAMGFTTLDVLAFAARESSKGKNILSILNAGKGEWYFQLYAASPWRAVTAPALGKMESALQMAGNAVLVGNANSSAHNLTTIPITFPRADALAELAATHAADYAQDMKPFYIRPPDAKPQVKKA